MAQRGGIHRFRVPCRRSGILISPFSSALETTLAMKARYKTDAERYKTARQPEYDEKRRKGIDEIAEKALDLNMIAYEGENA